MAAYLGQTKIQKVFLNGKAYCLNYLTVTPIINGIRLLSSDNYVLADANGLYLIAKESE